MLRMEIALILVIAFIAYIYFGAERKQSLLHRTFAVLLLALIVNLVFDAATVYTVNHLETVPRMLNAMLHRLFIGSMVFVVYLFYQYIAILVEEETGKARSLDLAARVFLLAAELGVAFLEITYIQTPDGNYSAGPYCAVSYASVVFYLFLCAGLLLSNWKNIHAKKRFTIGIGMAIECLVCVLQGLNPTWLISGMGLTLMTLAYYLTLENPDILRAELTEQKMSMLYLKSQVNPHFLYNTLDAIRIQAQLDGDKKVADLIMKLVDFFRSSVKVNEPMITLDEEMEMIMAYLELMCYRYPKLHVSYDMDETLFEYPVPNFILQPIVENSLLHGLKNKGYQGEIHISAHKTMTGIEVCVKDSGSGFDEGKKARIEEMLLHYDRETKLEGNSIGVVNVQKRIKLLCGKEYGLHYTENADGGLTAHLLLGEGS